MRSYGFVDWSGDTGFKFSAGSSTHFVLSLISSNNYSALRPPLANLKAQLGLPDAFEFHFAHNSKTVRTAFFAALPHLDWEGAVLVVDKQKLPTEFSKMDMPSFCGFFLGHLLARAPLRWIAVKRLLIDDEHKNSPLVRGMRITASPLFLARGLKRTPKVRGKPAHLSDGIQIADMLAGALKERERGGVDYLRGSKEHLQLYRYKPLT